jgi:hypothetical protein
MRKSPALICPHCNGQFANPVYRETTIDRVMSSASGGRGRFNAREVHLAIAIVFALLVLGGGVTFYIQHAAPPSSRYEPTAGPTVSATANDTGMSFPPSSPTDTAESAVPRHHLTGKFNAYVACLQTYEDVRDAMGVYFSWRKEPLLPPHCEEKYVGRGILPIPLDQVDDCEVSLPGADRMAPQLPQLHAAARAYVKTLQKAAPIFKMASAYYIKKKYTEDDCLKGKVLHPQLLKKFERITQRRNQLWQQIATGAKGELARCIEWSARYPARKSLHHLARIVAAAQKLAVVSRIESQSVTPDMTRVRRTLSTLQNEIDEFFSEAERLPDTDEKELFENLTAATTEFIRTEAGHFPGPWMRGLHLRNGQPIRLRSGTVDSVMEAFHLLLKRYNNRAKNYCTTLIPCNDDNRCPER